MQAWKEQQGRNGEVRGPLQGEAQIYTDGGAIRNGKAWGTLASWAVVEQVLDEQGQTKHEVIDAGRLGRALHSNQRGELKAIARALEIPKKVEIHSDSAYCIKKTLHLQQKQRYR